MLKIHDQIWISFQTLITHYPEFGNALLDDFVEMYEVINPFRGCRPTSRQPNFVSKFTNGANNIFFKNAVTMEV